MPVREDQKPNFQYTLSNAIGRRASGLEGAREIAEELPRIRDRRIDIPLKELEAIHAKAQSVSQRFKMARRLLIEIIEAYPEKEKGIAPMLERATKEWHDATDVEIFINKRIYDETPMMSMNPFAKSTQQMRRVVPTPSMQEKLDPSLYPNGPTTMPSRAGGEDPGLDRSYADDYDDGSMDLEEQREDVETMLSGLSSVLNTLGGPGLVFLQNQLAKLIEKL